MLNGFVDRKLPTSRSLRLSGLVAVLAFVGTVEDAVRAEEDRFEAVLTEGLPRLEAEIAKVTGTKSKVLSGSAAFQLYDAFGVPYDFIEDTAATRDEIEEPRANHAARAPTLGDGLHVHAWEGLGHLHDLEAFGVCLHEAVLDSVVDHLHEVP